MRLQHRAAHVDDGVMPGSLQKPNAGRGNTHFAYIQALNPSPLHVDAALIMRATAFEVDVAPTSRSCCARRAARSTPHHLSGDEWP